MAKKSAQVTDAPLSADELFEQLLQISEPTAAGRTSLAWSILLRAATAEDYHVGLDFALEHDLLPMSAAVRSDLRGPVQNIYRVNESDGSQMVWIPPGPFVVGDEGHVVESPGFYLARHPVTNAQFQRFLNATGYSPEPDSEEHGTFLQHWSKGQIRRNQEQHPVVWVSALDALAYCRWAGLTLPTEWLWEKAARGSDGRVFPWGDVSPSPYFATIAARATSAVGSHPDIRTAYGCEDMVGNVSEWCLTTDRPLDARLPATLPNWDRTNAPETIIVRGGCFLRSSPASLRASHRRALSPLRRNQWVGFRPAQFVLGSDV